MIPVYFSRGFLEARAKEMAHLYLASIEKQGLEIADWGMGIENGKIILRVYFPRDTVTTAMNSVHFDHAKALHYIEQPI